MEAKPKTKISAVHGSRDNCCAREQSDFYARERSTSTHGSAMLSKYFNNFRFKRCLTHEIAHANKIPAHSSALKGITILYASTPFLFPELNLKKAKKLNSRAKKSQAAELADLHLKLNPVATRKHRKGIITKIKQLLTKYTPAQVRVVIEVVSHRGSRGDGFGVVYKCLPFANYKLREQSFESNRVRDEKLYPKQPARGRSQPVILHGEEWTQREQNLQVRAVLTADSGVEMK